MATSTIYISLADFKTYAGIQVDTDDDLISEEIEAASRQVDEDCRRTFWQDDPATTRTFRPWASTTFFEFDPWELSTATEATVKVDTNDDGTFDETWTVSEDFIFTPTNLTDIGDNNRPITGIRLINKTIPSGGHFDRLQVVGKWGWETVPTAIREATKLVANELYARRNAPYGVQGFDAAGVVTSIRDTQRYRKLIQRYQKPPRF